MTKEIFARFRLSVDDLYKNQYSYVNYRKWGQLELWEGGRFSSQPPARQTSDQCVEVWHNWKLVGRHASRAAARRHVADLLTTCPASLHDLADYLEI